MNTPLPVSEPARLDRLATSDLVALILLCLASELWLAPLNPGGSWLVLKATPPMLPMPGIIRGRRYTHQWALVLALLYVAEGSIRAATYERPIPILAIAEVALAMASFVASVGYARAIGAGHLS